MKELKEKIKRKEIVVFKSDKSGKMTVDSMENYSEAISVHTEGDTETHRIIFPYLSDRLKRLRTFFIISPRVLKFCMKPPTPILDKTRI